MDKINGYQIRWNRLYKMWQVSHDNIGANIAEFDYFCDVVIYCKNG